MMQNNIDDSKLVYIETTLVDLSVKIKQYLWQFIISEDFVDNTIGKFQKDNSKLLEVSAVIDSYLRGKYE